MQPVIAMHLTKKSVKKLKKNLKTQMMMNQWTKYSEKENIENIADNTEQLNNEKEWYIFYITI